MKKALLLLLMVGIYAHVSAQNFSYVYIQSDKDLSFYVKYENEMLPRYGKNYTVISRLAPGPMKLELLFEKNEFPPVTFNIMVPDGGERSFLLSRKSGSFSLYDMQQNFILEANNDINDDRLPPSSNVTAGNLPVSVEEESYLNESTSEAPTKPAKEKRARADSDKIKSTPQKKESSLFQKLEKPAKEKKLSTQQSSTSQERKPIFIPKQSSTSKDLESNDLQFLDFELPNTPKNGNTTEMTVKDLETRQSEQVYVTNTDCPVAISDEEYEQILQKLRQAGDDEERLQLFNRHADECYTLLMTKNLVQQFDQDAARYSVLQKIYPRVVNQHEFPDLVILLKSGVYQQHFREMVGAE